MAHITAAFSSKQLSSVKKVASPSDIVSECPQNFHLLSECFAAIAFYDIPANGSAEKPVNYTIRADSGLTHIDVVKHSSDFELRILPLQWAVDQVRLTHNILNRLLTLCNLKGDRGTQDWCSVANTIGMAIYDRDERGAAHRYPTKCVIFPFLYHFT